MVDARERVEQSLASDGRKVPRGRSCNAAQPVIRRWVFAGAFISSLVLVGVTAVVRSQATSDDLVPYEIAGTGVHLSLPDWHVRTVDDSHAIHRAMTSGSNTRDQVVARAQDVIEQSGQVRELVLIRDRGAEVTPSVHVWVNPSSARLAITEQLRRGMPSPAPPGFVILEGPRALTVPGAGDAGLVRFRGRAGYRGRAMHEGETRLLQLRSAGHLVTINMTTPVEAAERIGPLFDRVIASVAAGEGP